MKGSYFRLQTQALRNETSSEIHPKERHPSVLALLGEAKPGESAEDIVRRKCREMVTRAKASGWNGPPFDPEILASLQGIKVETTDDCLVEEGRIFPRRGEVVIQYRIGRPLERQRFTICHELAHTCFPDAFEYHRQRSGGGNYDDLEREFEMLCDIGAAELLMPHDDFLSELNNTHVCLTTADALRSRYIASIDATLRRVFGLTTYPCAAVFLTDSAFKDFPAIPGQMRIKFFWKTGTFRRFLPPGTLAPDGSSVLKAPHKAPDNFSPAAETWSIDGKPQKWLVEAIKLPPVQETKDYPKVVALFHNPPSN